MPTQVASKTQIRASVAGDRPALERFYETMISGDLALGIPPRDSARRALWLESLQAGINFVAEVDGRIAGHIVLMRSGSGAEMALFVDPVYRRQGLATALAQAVMDAGRRERIPFIWVLISGNNNAARNGLLNAGFRTIWESFGEMQMMYRL